MQSKELPRVPLAALPSPWAKFCRPLRGLIDARRLIELPIFGVVSCDLVDRVRAHKRTIHEITRNSRTNQFSASSILGGSLYRGWVRASRSGGQDARAPVY